MVSNDSAIAPATSAGPEGGQGEIRRLLRQVQGKAGVLRRGHDYRQRETDGEGSLPRVRHRDEHNPALAS
jgi:hypothetical protein